MIYVEKKNKNKKQIKRIKIKKSLSLLKKKKIDIFFKLIFFFYLMKV